MRVVCVKLNDTPSTHDPQFRFCNSLVMTQSQWGYLARLWNCLIHGVSWEFLVPNFSMQAGLVIQNEKDWKDYWTNWLLEGLWTPSAVEAIINESKVCLFIMQKDSFWVYIRAINFPFQSIISEFTQNIYRFPTKRQISPLPFNSYKSSDTTHHVGLYIVDHHWCLLSPCRTQRSHQLPTWSSMYSRTMAWRSFNRRKAIFCC